MGLRFGLPRTIGPRPSELTIGLGGLLNEAILAQISRPNSRPNSRLGKFHAR